MSVMQVPWWWPFGSVPGVGADELLAALASPQPPQLLDVRSRGEFDEDHLPGAVNVPITELRRRLAELRLDRERPVVVICLTAHRSIPGVRLLARAGYRDARQLDGGMLGLRRARARPAR
jgi:rhodanese-related sulfurtransferase